MNIVYTKHELKLNSVILMTLILTNATTSLYRNYHLVTGMRSQNGGPSYNISLEICTRFCFAVLCCGYTLTDFPISIRLTSLALWQSNDCSSASKATLMNMDKYFMWIHYERLHNHNKAKHNKTVCILFGIYCTCHTLRKPCCGHILSTGDRHCPGLSATGITSGPFLLILIDLNTSVDK